MHSYRNPNLIADMARTIDHMCEGRFIFGIGSGWFERDYDEYGYDFGTPGARLADLAQALPRIHARWGKLSPAPTRAIPVLVGGGGEKKTLRYTAEHANIWHGFGDAETIAHKHAVLDGHCATIGRDPGEIEVSVAGKADGRDRTYELGARLFTINVGGPEPDLGELREALAWRDERNA